MYDYISLRIDPEPCDENIKDLLAAFLADIDFETFEPDEKGLTAYVRKDKYDPKAVDEIIEGFPIVCDLKISTTEIEGRDWNLEWERNYFRPIIISDRVVIRSSFHEKYSDIPIEIVIDPKMAFGTGHHATTAGMVRMLLDTSLVNKKVIDMGTGTGILAILSKKLGSGEVVGIDIDEFALENAKENGELNSQAIKWEVGDHNILEKLEQSDIFLANINLNVITANLTRYVAKLKPGGLIFLSGFLNGDREKVMQEATKNGLVMEREDEENNWKVMVFRKDLLCN